MKYTEDRIERLLSEELAAQTPDVLRQVAEAEITPEIVLGPVPLRRTRRRTAAKVCAALAASVVLACSAGGYAYFSTDAVVGIEVNPSIVLRLNRFERVLAVEAKNADAEAVLRGMELKNTTVDTAVSAIVGSLLQHDYLKDGAAVRVTVTGRGGERREALETRIAADIEDARPAPEADLPEDAPQQTPPPTQETPEDAPQPTPEPAQTTPPPEETPPARQPVAQQEPPRAEEPAPPADTPETPQETPKPSNGKQLLIDQLLTAAPSLDADALGRMSVKQLCELADDLDIDLYNAGGQKLDDDGKPEDDHDDDDDDDDGHRGNRKDHDDDDDDDD